MFFSYEEWKVTREPPHPHADAKELILYEIAKEKVREKALKIIRHPDIAYKLMTRSEREMFKYELNLLDPVLDCMELNTHYSFKIPIEDLKASLGIKIFWYLDRIMSYYHTEVKEYEKRKKSSK